jgi:hypothetical protein
MNDEHQFTEEETAIPLSNGKWWVDCWNCQGEIYVDHNCGEDCCACAFPEDNVVCDICEGKGGWERDFSTPESSEGSGG